MRTKMNHFRPLNENEIHCLKTKAAIAKLHLDYVEDIQATSVQYTRMQGGFTVAVVKYDTDQCTVLLYVGASRCSYKDKPNTTRGEILAFRRAIQTKPILLSSSSDVEGVPL